MIKKFKKNLRHVQLIQRHIGGKKSIQKKRPAGFIIIYYCFWLSHSGWKPVSISRRLRESVNKRPKLSFSIFFSCLFKPLTLQVSWSIFSKASKPLHFPSTFIYPKPNDTQRELILDISCLSQTQIWASEDVSYFRNSLYLNHLRTSQNTFCVAHSLGHITLERVLFFFVFGSSLCSVLFMLKLHGKQGWMHVSGKFHVNC